MIKKRILFLTTTRDFLGKFEQGNVKILQNKGFEVHYAANMQGSLTIRLTRKN